MCSPSRSTAVKDREPDKPYLIRFFGVEMPSQRFAELTFYNPTIINSIPRNTWKRRLEFMGWIDPIRIHALANELEASNYFCKAHRAELVAYLRELAHEESTQFQDTQSP